jgi:hypothetical protein
VNVGAKQKIEMLGDGAGERVFDGDYSAVDGLALDTLEDFARATTGNNSCMRQHGFGGLVAEGTEFSLDCDLHLFSIKFFLFFPSSSFDQDSGA